MPQKLETNVNKDLLHCIGVGGSAHITSFTIQRLFYLGIQLCDAVAEKEIAWTTPRQRTFLEIKRRSLLRPGVEIRNH